MEKWGEEPACPCQKVRQNVMQRGRDEQDGEQGNEQGGRCGGKWGSDGEQGGERPRRGRTMRAALMRRVSAGSTRAPASGATAGIGEPLLAEN